MRSFRETMINKLTFEGALARSITRAASQQAHYTIYLLVDRERIVGCTFAFYSSFHL